jgi:hypothetical protein
MLGFCVTANNVTAAIREFRTRLNNFSIVIYPRQRRAWKYFYVFTVMRQQTRLPLNMIGALRGEQ